MLSRPTTGLLHLASVMGNTSHVVVVAGNKDGFPRHDHQLQNSHANEANHSVVFYIQYCIGQADQGDPSNPTEAREIGVCGGLIPVASLAVFLSGKPCMVPRGSFAKLS